MPAWTNHSTIAYTSNTTSATVDPNGTAIAGVAFTPTSGRLIFAVVSGPVTATTPTGWTRPTNGNQVGNGGLYLFYRTAAGSDTITTANNGNGYHCVVDFYEFPAGSSFVVAGGGTGYSNGAAGPSISGLTGSTNCVTESVEQNISGGEASSSNWTFGSGTESTDVFNDYAGGLDGVSYGAVRVENYSSSSWSSPTASCDVSAVTHERIAWAVSVAVAGGNAPVVVVSPSAAVTRAAVW